ncbi:uncharacterized protein LOC129187604 [Dunckerocampus dactyliophorus]|uniref:uncharacterized protein LOC129187604 n=1 Tax=Dunckerocampus dactyliophorus TaxID=161453 RepID=UPI0024061DDB|nr:uncharacterized protein LOC129187604 [Dunckerocampus dactyliophorus]
MAHFRGQIRGPHWGAKRDNILIDFWKKHECLFNSSLESFYDKELKTKLWSECALLIGKSVSDVERRSRSLRTQYGRVLCHPERVNTFQQRMLREKLNFLRPYIVRRRSDCCPEDKSDEHEEDDGELETEGSGDHETGSTLDADETLEDRFTPGASTSNPSNCPYTQPHPADATSLSFEPHGDKVSPDVSDQFAAANLPKDNILEQFVNIMLADMRQIKNHMVLMKLRRDITDLVFKAVEEDMQRRIQVCFTHQGETAPLHSSFRPQASYSHRVFRRTNKGPEKHMERMCRNQAGPTQEEVKGGSVPQAVVQVSEIKLELEPQVVKNEEETLPVL